MKKKKAMQVLRKRGALESAALGKYVQASLYGGVSGQC